MRTDSHTSSAEADEPDGTAFGQACGAVTVLAIPGSNETRDGAGRDAAVATLADATAYVTEHADACVQAHYLGYPAQLVPYGDSRAHGYEAAWSTIDYYAQQCSYTTFIPLGYSQGAHIAGDLAATIGSEASPVSADRIRSVHLLSDPARDPDVAVVGSGGARGGVFGQRGDFGALNGRVTEYCNDQDAVCNSSFSSMGYSLASFLGAHTAYESTLLSNGQQLHGSQEARCDDEWRDQQVCPFHSDELVRGRPLRSTQRLVEFTCTLRRGHPGERPWTWTAAPSRPRGVSPAAWPANSAWPSSSPPP